MRRHLSVANVYVNISQKINLFLVVYIPLKDQTRFGRSLTVKGHILDIKKKSQESVESDGSLYSLPWGYLTDISDE